MKQVVGCEGLVAANAGATGVARDRDAVRLGTTHLVVITPTALCGRPWAWISPGETTRVIDPAVHVARKGTDGLLTWRVIAQHHVTACPAHGPAPPSLGADRRMATSLSEKSQPELLGARRSVVPLFGRSLAA